MPRPQIGILRLLRNQRSDEINNQTTPSPFVNSSKYVCYARQIVQKDANSPSYTFAGIAYGGSQPGNYELTFVAEDSSTTPATQWSEDPEFDTGN